MKKLFLFLLCLTALTNSAILYSGNHNSHKITLDSSVFNGNSVPFLPFREPGPFGRALLMNIPFKPVNKVFKQIKKSLGFTNFSNRGEAHITVITPIEYFKVLYPRVTINEIDILARRYKIQKSSFTIPVLGSGKKVIDNKLEQTFFLVVKSKALLNLRKKINEYFIAQGGNPGFFKPERYYPHITVGFTKRDLHASDGVIKDIYTKDPRFKLIH
ncbi:hypothetical protein ACFL35_17580, partial [Candidatus Riflebacteria bacterium]